MPRTLYSPRYDALREVLFEARKAAGLSQAALAKKIGSYQSYIADLERGERRLDVVDFLDLMDALGLDAAKTLKRIAAVRRR